MKLNFNFSINFTPDQNELKWRVPTLDETLKNISDAQEIVRAVNQQYGGDNYDNQSKVRTN